MEDETGRDSGTNIVELGSSGLRIWFVWCHNSAIQGLRLLCRNDRDYADPNREGHGQGATAVASTLQTA